MGILSIGQLIMLCMYHRKTGDCLRAVSPGEMGVYLRLPKMSNEPSPRHRRPKTEDYIGFFCVFLSFFQIVKYSLHLFLLVIEKVEVIPFNIGCQ